MKRFLIVFLNFFLFLNIQCSQQQASTGSGWILSPATQQKTGPGWSESPSISSQVSTGSGWTVYTPSQQKTGPGWTVTSSLEDSIVIQNTNSYGTVSENLSLLQQVVQQVTNFYQEELYKQSFWGGSSQPTDQQVQQYQAMFTQYLQAIAGENSYKTCLQEAFQGYQQLYQLYLNQLGQNSEEGDPNAELYFLKKPFQKGSFALDLAQSIVGSILGYIRTRMQLITVDNSESSVSQDFFIGTASQFQQLQLKVDAIEGICESNFSQLQSSNSITQQELVVLKDNYKSIFTSYETQSCNMMVAFTLKLLNQLSIKYPIDFALHSNVTTMQDNLVVAKELYALSKSSINVLTQNAKQQSTTASQNGNSVSSNKTQKMYFGIYSSLQDVLQALGAKMGNLLSYSALVTQNVIKNHIEEKNLNINVSFIQKEISKASVLYLQAAGCYYDAQNMPAYSAAAGVGKYLALINQSWSQAQKNDAPGTYGYAAEQYQIAYEAAQQASCIELSFLLLRFYNNAMLNYAQYTLNQYVNFSQYQTDIAAYVQNAFTVPQSSEDSKENLIQNLFYSSGSSSFYGIAGLSSQVAGSYIASLSSLEATQQSISNNKKLLLQNGITVTQNISEAAQAMLVGNSAADANIYGNYYNPEAVFYGQQQYFDIIHNFQTADTALQQVPQNTYAPFVNLFAQSPVKNFSDFILIHFARISLMSALQAEQYSDDPNYPSYNKPCTISSFLSFLSSYKGYRILAQNELAEYCFNRIEALGEEFDVLVEDAQNRTNNPKATQFDYQMALAELQGVSLFGNQQVFQIYQGLVQQYAQKLSEKVFNISFSALAIAYTYYQVYLLSVFQKNQSSVKYYEQAIQKAVQVLIVQIDDAQKFVADLSNPFNERIATQKQLKDLQTQLEQYSIAQYYDKGLFGIQDNNFCVVRNLVSTKKSSIPQIEISFITGDKKVLLNPLYQLANLYMTSSDAEFQQLQQNFNSASPTYSLFTVSRFKELIQNYRTALTLFGQLGLQDKVIQVEQALSKVAAFQYLSAVIPTDQVKNITLSINAIVNNNTQAFQTGSVSSQGSTPSGWSLNSTPGSQASNVPGWSLIPAPGLQTSTTSGWSLNPSPGVQEQTNQASSPAQTQTSEASKPSILPYYLLADWEVNLSLLVTNANTIAQQASQNMAEGTSIPLAMTQKQQMYNKILNSAQKLIGKEESINNIIKDVVVPLFADDLQNGGFQGVFRTLDEEVDLYSQQLAYLVNNGMQVGESVLKTTFQIVTQENNVTGENDIVLRGANIPLSAIPRYHGDMNCAIYYYALYQKFFNQTGQPVCVDGQIYFPITGKNAIRLGEASQRNIDRAYLASALQYKQKIAYLVSPLEKMSSQEKLEANFQNYTKQYNQLNKAYEWQIALISAIGTLQTQAGLGYVDVNKENSDLYKSWAQDSTLFLFGAPIASSYVQVLNNIQGYYDLAAQSSTSPSTQISLYQQAAQLNINAAQICETMEQDLPQAGGYPSAQPTGLPSGSTNFGTETFGNLKCGAAPAYSMLKDKPVTWKYYEDAYIHYSEALKLYKQSLAVGNSQNAANSNTTNADLSNQVVRNLTGRCVMCYVRASLQRIALFTRNAWKVTMNGQDYAPSVNPLFENIRENGASGGALSAVSGQQALLYGTGQQNSGDGVSQYEIMKKLILDANIYMDGALGATAALLKELPALSSSQTKTNVPSIAGSAIVCGIANTAPDLPVVILDRYSKKQVLGKAVAWSDNVNSVTLSALLPPSTSQITFPCLDTFANFVEYATNALIGNEQNNFETLNSNEQVSALNNFLGQLAAVFANLYKQTFLPTLMKDQSNVTNIKKATTSFTTAVQAAEQNLLINSTGYLG